MAKYNYKFWFEWGCSEDVCPCLWSDDGVVSIFDLPISKELLDFLCKLGMEHDKALNWSYPPAPLLWTFEEEADFYKKAKEGYNRLVKELGDDYKIDYCEDK